MFRIFLRRVNRPFIKFHLRIAPLFSPILPIPDCVGSCHASAVLFLIGPFCESFSGLQRLIKSTSLPSSPFYQLHAAGSTDVTLRPLPNAPNPTGETDKKRKWEVGDTNDHVLSDAQHGFPNLFHANKHLVTVHKTLKRVCEQLIKLTVSPVFLVPVHFSTFVSSRTRLSCG